MTLMMLMMFAPALPAPLVVLFPAHSTTRGAGNQLLWWVSLAVPLNMVQQTHVFAAKLAECHQSDQWAHLPQVALEDMV
jgi:hypothetical protein